MSFCNVMYGLHRICTLSQWRRQLFLALEAEKNPQSHAKDRGLPVIRTHMAADQIQTHGKPSSRASRARGQAELEGNQHPFRPPSFLFFSYHELLLTPSHLRQHAGRSESAGAPLVRAWIAQIWYICHERVEYLEAREWFARKRQGYSYGLRGIENQFSWLWEDGTRAHIAPRRATEATWQASLRH